MNQTTIANLALMKIGETTIKGLGDMNEKGARMAALHYEPALREVLRAHFWNFATTVKPLEAADTRAYLEIGGSLKKAAANLSFPRLYQKSSPVDGKPAYAGDPVDDETAVASTAEWDGMAGEWALWHGPSGAAWKRMADVATPDKKLLYPAVPKHALETNLAGANNDLRYEQVDQRISPVTVEYAEPEEMPAVIVEVSGGRDILVRPKTGTTDATYELRYTGYTSIAGITHSGFNSYHFHGYDTAGNKVWAGADGIAGSTGFTSKNRLWWEGGYWWFSKLSITDVGDPGASPGIWKASAATAATAPHTLSYTPHSNCTGTVTMTALPRVYPATTAADVKAAIEAHAEAAELVAVSLKSGNNGTGVVVEMPKAGLSGGVTGIPDVVLVNPGEALGRWRRAFLLPGDFLKLRRVLDAGGGAVDKFALRRVGGHACLLCDAETVSLEYVPYLDEPAAYDPLFTAALVSLLAGRLARAITGSEHVEAQMRQLYETVDLPAARAADGQDSQSNENHPLGELLAGSLTKTRGSFF